MRHRFSLLLALVTLFGAFATSLVSAPAFAGNSIRALASEVRLPYVVVQKKDPKGYKPYIAVFNGSDKAVDIQLTIDRQRNAAELTEDAWMESLGTPREVDVIRNYTLQPFQTKTWALRDLSLPYVRGYFIGKVRIYTLVGPNGEQAPAVLGGDYIVFNEREKIAHANQLIPWTGYCAQNCTVYYARYLRSSGVSENTFHFESAAGFFENPNLSARYFAESGSPAGEETWFDISDPVEVKYTLNPAYIADDKNNVMNPLVPLGLAEFTLPAPGTGLVYYQTPFGSVQLEPWCSTLKVCNKCDPNGPCYKPDSTCPAACIKPLYTVLTGSLTGTIGVYMEAILQMEDGTTFTVQSLPAGLTSIALDGNRIKIFGVPTGSGEIKGRTSRQSPSNCFTDIVGSVTGGNQIYKINLRKKFETKGCAPSGGTATVVFTIEVENLGTTEIKADVTDVPTPSCVRTNLPLAVGETKIYTCSGPFPIGPGSNTATAKIVDRNETSSGTANFTISQCAGDPCANVGTPAFSFTENTGATTAATTAKLVFPLGFTGAVSFGTVPTTQAISGFLGGPVLSGSDNVTTWPRPLPGQTSLAIGAAWSVSNGGQVCKQNTANVIIQPQPQTGCAGVPEPTSYSLDVIASNNTQATVRGKMTYTGAGVTGALDFNPNSNGGCGDGSLASGANCDGLFNQGPNEYPVTGTFKTIKNGETCWSQPRTVTIPKKTQTCEQEHPPTGDMTFNASASPLLAHANIFSKNTTTGTWHLYIHAWDNYSSCTGGSNPQYEKTHVQKTLICNQSGILDTSYPWGGHGANGWRVRLYLGTTLIEDSGCINNTQNNSTPANELSWE